SSGRPPTRGAWHASAGPAHYLSRSGRHSSAEPTTRQQPNAPSRSRPKRPADAHSQEDPSCDRRATQRQRREGDARRRTRERNDGEWFTNHPKKQTHSRTIQKTRGVVGTTHKQRRR